MDLIKVYQHDKAVTELIKVSEYFNKRHDILLRDIRELIHTDPSLVSEFIATNYINKRGKTYPTFYLTKEGFYLLVSSFSTKRAIKWKREFFKQYEEMEKHIKQLQAETLLINEHEDDTYCISDICCKFKKLDPVNANKRGNYRKES